MRYTEIMKEAKRLYDLGFAIHWLHPKSKRPVESGWGSGPRKDWRELEGTFKAGYNVGVRLGTPSKLAGGYLGVVDLDIKSKEERHRIEALSAATGLVGGAPCPIVASGRGGGSRHFYCITAEPFKTFNPAQSDEMVKVHQPSKKPSKAELKQLTPDEIESGIRLSHAWEISLYSDGRQVVLPPSVHPDSGKLYAWERVLKGAKDLPELRFNGALKRTTIEKGDAATTTLWSESDFKFTPKEIEIDWLDISDDVRDAIVDGKNVDDRSAYLLRASKALIAAGLDQDEVLSVLTDPKTYLGACGYEHAQTKDRVRAAAWVHRYTFKKAASECNPVNAFGVLPKPEKMTAQEMEAEAAEFARKRNWRHDLDKTKEGRTRVSLKNLDLIFTNMVDGQAFIEDLFASRIEYGADTPWGGKKGAHIKDIDLILVKRWCADTEFGIEPNRDPVLEATSLVAHRCRIHPVREWLDSLKWDGVSRVDTWIKDYCQGNAQEPYLSEVSRKFLLAMVKRVFEPGCQWDYVLVLEGKQGKYKSSIARALASDRWFMDNLPDLKDKDSMLNLQGKWLIELGELADIKRTDYNLVKAYLVRRTDTVRPHYGRLQADVPRQSVFIGTINEGQYLKDPTGNRRYWPVRVGLCDVEGLKRVRDQLFAEAMHIYRTTNEVLMLGESATVQATEAQEERRVEDDASMMKEALIDFIESEKSDSFDFHSFRARDLMVGVDVPWGPWNGKGYVMNTAAQVLESMGFEPGRNGSRRVWKMVEKTLFKKHAITRKK